MVSPFRLYVENFPAPAARKCASMRTTAVLVPVSTTCCLALPHSYDCAPRPRENLTWSTWRIATWKHGPRGDFYTFTVSGHRWHGKCRVPVPCSRVGARRSAVASCARLARGARGHGQGQSVPLMENPILWIDW